jgi:hypothetical protein
MKRCSGLLCFLVSRRKRNGVLRKLLVVLIGLTLAGCSFAETGRLITSEQLDQFRQGTTTRDEVLRLLGPPLVEVPPFPTAQAATPDTTAAEPPATAAERGPSYPRYTAHYYYARLVFPTPEGYRTTVQQFWVQYDPNGIVQEFGLDDSSPAANP